MKYICLLLCLKMLAVHSVGRLLHLEGQGKLDRQGAISEGDRCMRGWGVFIIGEMSREGPHSERKRSLQSSELKAIHVVLN